MSIAFFILTQGLLQYSKLGGRMEKVLPQKAQNLQLRD
jgi:hypothetical protein